MQYSALLKSLLILSGLLLASGAQLEEHPCVDNDEKCPDLVANGLCNVTTSPTSTVASRTPLDLCRKSCNLCSLPFQPAAFHLAKQGRKKAKVRRRVLAKRPIRKRRRQPQSKRARGRQKHKEQQKRAEAKKRGGNAKGRKAGKGGKGGRRGGSPAARKPTNRKQYWVFKQSINQRANPCTNFFNYACGEYQRSHKSKGPGQNFAVNQDLQQKIDDQLAKLILASKEPDPGAVKTMQIFRDKCLDGAAVEAEKTASLIATMDSIGQGFPLFASKFDDTKFDLTDTLTKISEVSGHLFLYNIEARPDPSTPAFMPGNLIVDTPMAYEPGGEQAVSGLQNFLVGVLKLIAEDHKSTKSADEITKAVEEVMNFDRGAAKIQKENGVGQMPPNIEWMMQLKKLSDLQTNVGEIKWEQYLKTNVLIPDELKGKVGNEMSIMMNTEKMLKELDAYYKAASKTILANYIFVQFIMSQVPYLDNRFKTIGMNPPPPAEGLTAARPNECIGYIQKFLPLVTDFIYVSKALNKRTLPMINQIIADVQKQIGSMFKSKKWMTPGTKNAAIKKVNQMKKIVGGVDAAKKKETLNTRYAALQLADGDLFRQMVVKATIFTTRKELSQPTPRSEMIRATDVNAEHIYDKNEIFISAAHLFPPFFDPHQPASVNYGALGTIVAGAMMRAVDQHGIMMPVAGKMNWWDKKTKQKFDNSAKCFKSQYSKLTVPGTKKKVNGAQTLSQNVVENAAVRVASSAYRKRMGKKQDGKVTGYPRFSPGKSFYISYATSLCASVSKETLQKMLAQGIMTPVVVGINAVVKNTPHFAQTFGCKPNNPMNPKSRCQVW